MKHVVYGQEATRVEDGIAIATVGRCGLDTERSLVTAERSLVTN